MDRACLLGDQNLPSSNNIAQRNTRVILPLLKLLLALNEHGEVLARATLVKDLSLGCVSTGHICVCRFVYSFGGVVSLSRSSK